MKFNNVVGATFTALSNLLIFGMGIMILYTELMSYNIHNFRIILLTFVLTGFPVAFVAYLVDYETGLRAKSLEDTTDILSKLPKVLILVIAYFAITLFISHSLVFGSAYWFDITNYGSYLYAIHLNLIFYGFIAGKILAIKSELIDGE